MAAVLWASLAVAACSSHHSARKPVSGAAVFAAQCSGCHSLIGNESLRRQGGDLVHFRMTASQLLQFAREMPTRRVLSNLELAAVVAYVHAAQGNR